MNLLLGRHTLLWFFNGSSELSGNLITPKEPQHLRNLSFQVFALHNQIKKSVFRHKFRGLEIFG